MLSCIIRLQSIEGSLKQLAPEMQQATARFATWDSQVAKINADIDKIHDEIFGAFCKSIGVAHIRDYEEKALVEVKEMAKKRTEFTKQVAALKTQLEYESSRDTKSLLSAAAFIH